MHVLLPPHRCSGNDNYFSSSIPTQLGNLFSLEKHFDLVSNKLTGQLPSQLAHWTSFTSDFHTGYNSLCGAIVPSQLDSILSMSNLEPGWPFDDYVLADDRTSTGADWLEGNLCSPTNLRSPTPAPVVSRAHPDTNRHSSRQATRSGPYAT